MQRIMLLNPKGGCGKTTIATNLAAYYACRGCAAALMDYDHLGLGTCWLSLRSGEHVAIYGIAAYRNAVGVTRSWQLRIPAGIERVVIDSPGGVGTQQVEQFVRQADVILVPVLPSPIDINAMSLFVRYLARRVRTKSPNTRLGIVVNRVPPGAAAMQALERLLAQCEVPFVTWLRDSQHYAQAAGMGLGIHDLHLDETVADREQWVPLVRWLEQGGRGARPPLRVVQPSPVTMAG
jgi:chromosome partitioning protein